MYFHLQNLKHKTYLKDQCDNLVSLLKVNCLLSSFFGLRMESTELNVLISCKLFLSLLIASKNRSKR